MGELAIPGKRVPQVDAHAKATGQAVFTTDMTLPGPCTPFHRVHPSMVNPVSPLWAVLLQLR